MGVLGLFFKQFFEQFKMGNYLQVLRVHPTGTLG